MEPIVLDYFRFQPQFDLIARELKIKPVSSAANELKSLISDAEVIAKPKAIYTITSIEKKDQHVVYLNDVKFNSQLLCINLRGLNRTFPYIVTCGVELDHWKNSIKDTITHFFADHITGLALKVALEGLFTQIKKRYGLKQTATMNPGSLEDWPLQAQTPLFSLFGNPELTIGVRLTESLLMVPRQSVSGILFETETDFENCRLCPKENCPSRKVPYNELVAQKYLG